MDRNTTVSDPNATVPIVCFAHPPKLSGKRTIATYIRRDRLESIYDVVIFLVLVVGLVIRVRTR